MPKLKSLKVRKVYEKRADKVTRLEREAAEAHAARIEEVRKTLPGGQISMRDLLPDPVGASVQGPMEVVQATFANCGKAIRTRI